MSNRYNTRVDGAIRFLVEMLIIASLQPSRLDACVAASQNATPLVIGDTFTIHYESMPEEKHSTIYHPAALRAFRDVFKPRATGLSRSKLEGRASR